MSEPRAKIPGAMGLEEVDIAIVGGGAAGMMAAIRALEIDPSLQVALLERQPRPARKLLATGNGRSNLLNIDAAPEHYHGADFVRPALAEHPPEKIAAYFTRLGLTIMIEDEGRAYPVSGQAASVVDVLRLSLNERGARIMPDFDVMKITRGFALFAADGRGLRARRVILATGGPASPKLGGTPAGHRILKALNHTITPVRAALAPLNTAPDVVRALKGLRAPGTLSLFIDERPAQTSVGEVLFTDTGLSGIAAMELARAAGDALAAGKQPVVHLKLLPERADEVLDALTARASALPDRALDDFLTGLTAKRIGQQLMKLSGAAPLSRAAASLTKRELRALAALLTNWPFPVTGTRGMDGAQVTAGGADTSEFDPHTLESTRVPGLYAAGEVLDIDGPCGGYNLTWAWASGLLAAEAAVRSLKGT